MNILLIGLGSIGAKHVVALATVAPDANVFALRTRSAGQANTSTSGVTNVYSFDDLPTDIAFVIISNPTAAHHDTIRQAANLGVPLFIEKPVLHNLEGAEDLLSLLKEKNILTYVACNLRFHPALKFVKESIATSRKKIDEINIYCGSYLPSWRQGRNFRELYSANADQGGGVHLDLIHEIDYCYWLFGRPDAALSVKTNNSHLQITAFDYAHYVFTYPDFTAAITLNYFRRDPKREMEIIFDDTTWKVDLLNCTITDSEGAFIFRQYFEMSQTYVEQLRYFLDRMRNNRAPMNSIHEAVEVLSLALTS